MRQDWEDSVQRRAEQHLDACFEAMYAQEKESDETVPSPAVAPFDGCNTCIVREVLQVTWDEMLAHARQEVGGGG